MAILLPDLLADPALRLAAEGSAEPPALPIRWVAATELEDPRPFLSGAEVVLTTGIRLKTGAAQRAFVQHSREAGVLAIGFGVGLAHRRVPAALLAEADDAGVPVFRVPYEIPFIAIGKRVADALSTARSTGLENLLEGHAVLASALLGAGGLTALLAELAGMLGTEVALFQYGARIAGAAAPDGERTEPVSWYRVPVATGLQDRCTLAIAQPFGSSAVVDYAQSLISVELTNQARNRTGARTATGQLIQDVARGTLTGAEATARLSGVGLDTGAGHRVLVVEVPAGQRRALRTLPLPSGWDDGVAALVEPHLVLVLPSAAGHDPEELGRYLSGAGLTARLGVGGTYAQANGLRWSYFEARDALQRGQPVNVADRITLTSLLMSSRDVPLGDLAEETLSPLDAFDAAHGAGLLPTLQRYLDLDGSVAAVAAALGLHRNTVRYRLQQVVTLTGYDPGVTADRVHLYLALRLRALG